MTSGNTRWSTSPWPAIPKACSDETKYDIQDSLKILEESIGTLLHLLATIHPNYYAPDETNTNALARYSEFTWTLSLDAIFPPAATFSAWTCLDPRCY